MRQDHFRGLLQETYNSTCRVFAPSPSIVIRLRFDYDDSYQNYDWTSIRLVRKSGHHDSMLMKARIHTRWLFTSEVGEKAIPTSTIERCHPMLIRQRECHSYYRDVHYYVIICPDHCLLYWLRRLSCSFFVVVESKSNRNCSSRLNDVIQIVPDDDDDSGSDLSVCLLSHLTDCWWICRNGQRKWSTLWRWTVKRRALLSIRTKNHIGPSLSTLPLPLYDSRLMKVSRCFKCCLASTLTMKFFRNI